jgi:hypothetical protein
MRFPNKIEDIRTISAINTGLSKNKKQSIFPHIFLLWKHTAALKATREKPMMIVNQLNSLELEIIVICCARMLVYKNKNKEKTAPTRIPLTRFSLKTDNDIFFFMTMNHMARITISNKLIR